ncbi:hypothetical protein DPMN_022965 [Dreissena polymorpha]|uniref:C2H2-type domain-containing protein n=2 Tax=Dreissena polymorpha TaxID=45954 RepID=A0A9D4RAY2_DREPO|nr:hypothetical protein DPMN_022965 [Dreissena polymorpha]
MNDADLMSSLYTSYAHNLASYTSTENQALLEQLQSLLKSNGAAQHSAGLATRKLSTDQGMDGNCERDDGVRPSCRFCGKTFAQASYIKAHERLHTGEKPYVCSVCNKAFSDASNWKKHERMHSRQIQSSYEDGVVSAVNSAPTTPEPLTPNSPTMKVTQMSNMNLTAANLNSHNTSFASTLSQIAACSLAGSMPGMFPEVTSSLAVLSHSLSHAHSQSHNVHLSSSTSQNSEDSNDMSPPSKRNKDDSLSCNLCSKTFSTPASLSMHKKIHSGEKPHTCITCGKSFTQIGTLRAHERVHTGEKPYECNICGKTFAQCGSFRMHERRHHRDMMENFQKCFVCGVSFTSMDELQKHMMCHPGALSFNLHHGPMGYPGPLPMGFGFPIDFDSKAEMKMDPSEISEIEKAFNLFGSQSKTAPVTSHADHYHLPPFVSSAHAFIQRSLSQSNDPNTAVSMLLASNGAENLLGQQFSNPGILSPVRLPIMPPERNQSAASSAKPVKEEVEPVSTTTRSRKYSSDSHTSMSCTDGKEKQSNDEDHENMTEMDNENHVPNHSQKTPSEDSSLAESRSTEDFQSDDVHTNGVNGGISRRNLNKRMISSSNSRKQRRPMRRLSSVTMATGLDQTEYQQQYNTEDGEEEEEELNKDQLMVSFLLSKGEVYKCEHCHIIFEDCTLYLLHNGFHANDRDPFKCQICKKSCDGRVEFNCHLTSHIK